jgi:hypothetical protein
VRLLTLAIQVIVIKKKFCICLFKDNIVQYKYIQMGITKTECFTEEQNQLATLAKALGHPARIAIIHLIKVNSCVCGDIVNELLAQPTISTFEGVKMMVSLKGILKVIRFVIVLMKTALKP